MSATTSKTESSNPPADPTSSKRVRLFSKPGYLLLNIASTILVSEISVMMVLQYLPPLPPVQASIVDGVLLLFIMFPALYFFFFRPLDQHMKQRQQAEAEKDRLIEELHKAFSEVKTLRGIVPICASCKKIRDDKGFWQQVEVYVSAHSDALFSHGICPECVEKLYPNFKSPEQAGQTQRLGPEEPRG
ncbi:MAG: hypothetical protein AB1461_17720 [Thermodesulfobacteriota bacterium]